MMISEVERERLMYEIIGSISASNAPIVFKGALITKLVLAESRFDDIARKTVDIDANWIGEPPDADQLLAIVSKAVANVSDTLQAKLTREYGDKKSAGILIFNRNSTASNSGIEMDISVNKFQESKIYTYNELTIKGVLPSEILADKISVLSSKKIFRRAKDFVDIYALAHCVEVRTSEIYASHKRNGRTLGAFTEFRTRKDDLNHAYKKLRGIENKPQFEGMYQYVSKFVQPFELDYKVDRVWNPKSSAWDDSSPDIDEHRHTRKPSLIEKLSRAKEKANAHNEQSREARRNLNKSDDEPDL